MKIKRKIMPREARHLPFKKMALSVCLTASVMLAGPSLAGENTKPVSINCEKQISGISKSVDPLGYGYKLILNAAKGKKMDMERLEALGEIDMLLTSSYGLRQPLATITNKRAAEQLALTSQLTMSGYVIAAQMTFGIIRKEALIPERTAFIAGNMIYTMTEPDDHDPTLGMISNKVKQADKELANLPAERLPFAKWLIRGYAFNDPVAVDAAAVGFCDARPTRSEISLVEAQARKVRLDPKKISVIKG